MGGLAFAQAICPGEPTLRTPRMSPTDYTRLKDIYLTRVREWFPGCKVATLLEAPEKTDYGDIDIKICCDEKNIDFVCIANRLGAAGIICYSGKGRENCTIGVLHNGSRSGRPVVVYKPVTVNTFGASKPSVLQSEEEYAQIDIEVLSEPDYVWNSFYASYSAMAILLGRIVNPLGFTINDKGLVLRLRELDESKDRASDSLTHTVVAWADGMLLLSSDPTKVMRFLGLSVQDFAKGFSTLEAMYRWVAQCRLLVNDAIRTTNDTPREKQRQQKRPTYTKFVNEWLLTHTGGERILEGEESEDARVKRRDDVRLRRELCLQEAIDFFDKRADYETLHEALIRKIENQTALQLLKPIVRVSGGKADKSLLEILRALRRWAGCREGEPYVMNAPHGDGESQLYLLLGEDKISLRAPEALKQWLSENWETLRSLERQRGRTQS